MRKMCPLSALLFNMVFEFLARVARQKKKKEMKGIQRGKEEINFPVFAGNMILHLED
jgi:hypothetical protein